MDFVRILITILAFGICVVAASILTFNPERILRSIGQMYHRFYKNIMHLSEDQIEKIPGLPISRLRMGSPSEFVTTAKDQPQNYPLMLGWYRAIGCFMWATLLFTAFIVIWAWMLQK